MYMEIYADVLFLICLVPELTSLWLMAGWYHFRVRKRRLFLVSALAAALSAAAAILLRTVPTVFLTVVDIPIQLLAFRLLFGKRTLRRDLESWLLQKLFYIGMGGLLQLGWRREEPGLGRLLLGFGAGAVSAGLLLYRLHKKKRLEEVLYQTELFWKGRSCQCTALMDTGNQLYYGKDTPVVLLAPEKAEELGYRLWEPDESHRTILYRSVGCPSGILYGFVCDRIVTAAGCYENIVVGVTEAGLSGTGDYQMLLHPALLKK